MFSRLKEVISAKYFDKNFRKTPFNYILQSLLIFICVSIILTLFEFFGGIIVASLGASSFIVFVSPHDDDSRARYLIGGYVCGAVVGVLFGFFISTISGFDFVGANYIMIIMYSASVAVTTFLMIITNLEHPPAAALCLGLAAAVDSERIKMALAALAGILILCGIRRLLRKHLKNL